MCNIPLRFLWEMLIMEISSCCLLNLYNVFIRVWKAWAITLLPIMISCAIVLSRMIKRPCRAYTSYFTTSALDTSLEHNQLGSSWATSSGDRLSELESIMHAVQFTKRSTLLYIYIYTHGLAYTSVLAMTMF